MNFVRMLSLLLTIIIAQCMVASAPSDIEQAYKTEKAKVDKTLKEKFREKKAKFEKTMSDRKAKYQEAKKWRAEAAKEKAAKAKEAKADKKAKTTIIDKTAKHHMVDGKQKQTKLDKASQAPKELKKEDTSVEKVSHRMPDIKKLEPMTVVKGEEFMINRPASPNFGRTWKLHKALPLQVEMVGKAKFVPAAHPGKNEGTMVFTFKGVKPGFTEIEFEKVYPVELRDKKPLKVRIIPVDIKEVGSK